MQQPSTLLHVETRTMVLAGDTYAPVVTLGNRPVPVTPPQVPPKGWGGYRMVVFERKQPTVEGVRLSKLYNVATGDGSEYTKVFTAMLNDLKAGGFFDSQYFFVLATYGMLNSFPPVPDFLTVLKQAGAGRGLVRWLESAQGIGTSHISADVSYILAGNMKSSPDTGAEELGLYPLPPNPKDRQPHTSKLDVFIDSQVGDPEILVSAESTAKA